MADIFISYSSKDRAEAEQLIELLGSAGLSVWIDRSGIDVATSWSGEIVQAINDCKAFVVLLSSNSLESHNVIKEVSLASEKRKKILPLDLEPVQLTKDFEYQLAGIQRAPMTNIDSIIRALGKLGLEATQAPTIKLVKETDARKSLMILPFDDLSPTGDNAWFADGIANELIAALSKLKALRVADQQTTKDYKRYQGTLPNYAKEMAIRYFVQGDVRKFGDNIKISVSLLDIETGDHLWQDSMRGTMNDIFDIQEKVAEKVVEGLKIHLASDEKRKLAERGTENAEAYELFLKANEYFQRHSKEGFQLAAQLCSEAITLDPAYASAFSSKATALASLYRTYSRDPALLEEGLTLIHEALRLKSDLWAAYYPLSIILMLQGKLAEAEAAAQEYIHNAPQDFMSHGALGFFYQNTDQYSKAIAPFEEALKWNPESLIALWNLVIVCNSAKEEEKQKYWSEIAIPVYEKRLKLFPDEETNRVSHAAILYLAGRYDDARAAARKLEDLRDGHALFNTACLQCELKDYSTGLQTFRKAIQAGYRNMRNTKLFLDDEDDGLGTLKGTPEWEEVRELVEKIVAEGSTNG
jgi:TolB-like protein/Flp pilus assembly protein TadD